MGFFNKHKSERKSDPTDNSRETWQLTISGIVQGVGFRWSVLNLAQKMGMTGSVRNNSDGTVTITLQAELSRVNQFCAELPKNISQFARISNIKKEKLTKVSKMTGFHVLY
ncbi:acylphosphatase [Lactobacillus sp. ESL0261]|uniref:acylphosphatase n=1 Tax=Lactobacillus sp. ESL0261 TaxID=2069348 RepID=UPI000EFB517F|nr:acylphosphatase [Lactobacillus sp. ESL0261]MBC6369330.1 acylphosphatase [Lactobacillus kullabergensis]RMC54274.1 acylphosphatase [Lactobacillus sp. ESL0261]